MTTMYTPPAMGYDRAITIFSPDGRLYQVEYAFEAVKRGWTTVGVRCREGVVLAVEKRRVTKLQDTASVEKVHKIDDHIAAAFAGIASDARVLIEIAREYALLNRLLYDEPIDVEVLVSKICDIKQAYTQHGGVRPFGVAFLFGGVDRKGPQLFMTEPSGVYIGYYAYAIGGGSSTVVDILEKKYSYDMSLDDAIILALYSLNAVVEGGIDSTRVEIAVIDVKTKQFKKLTTSEIDRYIELMKMRGV